MTPPHETPLDISEVTSKLGAVSRFRGVVVKAQYSPNPDIVERTIVFWDHGQHIVKALDSWLTPDTYEQLLAAFPQVAPPARGSCSAMYSTSPKYVWAHRDNELHLWQNKILVARFNSRESRVRRLLGIWSVIPATRLSSIHAFLSQTWIKRGVVLQRKYQRDITIASEREPMALIDPTYDGIDVMCDASWVVDLARAISAITKSPLKVDNSLL